MSFEVAGEAYDRFMGRYSRPLAADFAAWLAPTPGQRAIDVGCGPGALTSVLVDRLGADHVSAVDPSAPFVAACRDRLPGVDVRQAGAESLPYDDDSFDLAGACLVVHFMSDPVGGVAEMKRVTRPDGWVAATVWDLAGSRAPMAPLWEAMAEVAPEHPDESDFQGGSRASLLAVLEGAALRDIETTELAVTVTHPSFEEWWQPYQHGVGPAGEAVAALDPEQRAELERVLRRHLGEGPFDLTAFAYAARGRA
ncbi:methyltransferase domain-containing protein [Nocardioides sp.]|uniref:class I SAM-dependent methyltransferase n=1 Tax=Nocardioides sp. TaxID=35761 RepID=UPI0026133EE1|nr:methyltransferase domain-containing protein [Nocardioides sp.]MCW2737321.1 SAM-dependent methyltransferase [Nocardioides sp.]